MIYEVGKHRVELFDSIEGMSILRFQKFNKYMMQQNEVGSTFEDYDQSTIKAIEFIRHGMNEEAIQELNNRRQTVYNAYNNNCIYSMALSCLVKRIDNKYYSDIDDNKLEEVARHLDSIGLSYKDGKLILEEVKKK